MVYKMVICFVKFYSMRSNVQILKPKSANKWKEFRYKKIVDLDTSFTRYWLSLSSLSNPIYSFNNPFLLIFTLSYCSFHNEDRMNSLIKTLIQESILFVENIGEEAAMKKLKIKKIMAAETLCIYWILFCFVLIWNHSILLSLREFTIARNFEFLVSSIT